MQSWVITIWRGESTIYCHTTIISYEPDTNGSARISYIGESIGSNTEQIYLLNIKSIPPKNNSIENELQIIINSQFKLFFKVERYRAIRL
ncbi:fimbria/pilus periplasmic chaperone [Providencia hangzhouensis]|uniref:fimbria/pilus periplasmic chaperone n=1 Tax=Providencia hangzhouensis TaxID=3031799 RepID=UPI0034DD4C3F